MCPECFGHSMGGFNLHITLAPDRPHLNLHTPSPIKIISLRPPERNNRAITCIATSTEPKITHPVNI